MPAQLPFEIISDIVTYTLLLSYQDDIAAMESSDINHEKCTDTFCFAALAVLMSKPSWRVLINCSLVSKSIRRETIAIRLRLNGHPRHDKMLDKALRATIRICISQRRRANWAWLE